MPLFRFTERAIFSAIPERSQATEALKRSLEKVMESERSVASPELLVFSHPAPHALVFRPPWGQPTLLLSQGLLALMDEEEIRGILTAAARIGGTPSLAFASLRSALAVRCYQKMPEGWRKLLFSDRQVTRIDQEALSPFALLGFLLLFPVFSLLMGERRSVRAPSVISQPVNGLPALENPGLTPLSIVDPGSERVLFPWGKQGALRVESERPAQN